MPVRDPDDRPKVVDAEIFWPTVQQKGVFKVQHNEVPILTDYNYRIVQEGRIVASGDSPQAILDDLTHFTGEEK